MEDASATWSGGAASPQASQPADSSDESSVSSIYSVSDDNSISASEGGTDESDGSDFEAEEEYDDPEEVLDYPEELLNHAREPVEIMGVYHQPLLREYIAEAERRFMEHFEPESHPQLDRANDSRPPSSPCLGVDSIVVCI